MVNFKDRAAEGACPTLPAVEAATEPEARLVLSDRDSLRVIELLENPPAANEKLQRAAEGLREDRVNCLA